MMSMFLGSPASNQWPLGRISPSFQHEEIRAAYIDYMCDTNGEVQFFFRKWSTDIPNILGSWPATTTLQQAIDAVLTHEPPPRGAVPDKTPFDMRVGKRAWIFLKLSEAHGWHFRKSGHPVTSKSNREKHYAGLNYVSDSGDVYSGEQEVEEACRIVFFAAVQPPQGNNGTMDYEHGLNFHIDLLQWNDKRMPLVFDPDIKYPGGND